ncbi:MAG TPA: hypothetical protein VNB90_05750 [Cytophagaceae bacterium]|nr:hypothetical protein [Cytophagaceae bacterium]
MWEDLYKYFIVFFSSMFKFFVGLAFGAGFHLPLLVNSALAVLGMMTSVVLFTSFLGEYFHKWIMKTFYKNQKLFTKNNRRKVMIWKKFGLLGVAFLTPVLFTPIGGAMIANGFGESKERIFLYMFISAVIWALSSSYLFELIRLLPFFHA